jgi:hypothetical protein
MEMLSEYKISNKYDEKIINVLGDSPVNWLKEINKIAIKNNFQAIGKVKNRFQLV